MIPTLNSETANLISNTDLIVFEEIVAISREILTTSISSEITAIVESGTTMTDDTTYYEVWSGIDQDRKKLERMNLVVSYFQKLGYNIIRRLNATTNNTIVWEINW